MQRYQQYMYNYPHKTAYRALSGLKFSSIKPKLEVSDNNDLYIHIPFCETKCGYCNLFSVAGQKEEMLDAYISAMENQIAQYQLARVTFQELTIGGGTPLYLSETQLERLFLLIQRKIWFAAPVYPITVETSPRQTSKEKVKILKEHGVTRVSLGVQSFQEKELKMLGRYHQPKEAMQALEWLKHEGFSYLNLDLIYGVPGQTEQSVLESLNIALAFAPEELFLYPLYVKPGTRLWQQKLCPTETRYQLYCKLREILLSRGYQQTSMRRFVTQKQVKSVGCGFSEQTVSIGCGGRSYIGNLHFCTPYCISQASCRQALYEYMNTQDFQPIANGFILNKEEQKRRFLIKNLFYYQGLPSKLYQNQFLSSPVMDFPVLLDWIEQGYLHWADADYLCPTQKGMDLSDYLGPQLISPTVRERMEEWYASSPYLL